MLVRLRHQSPFEAVHAPRLHCTPDGLVRLEAERFSSDVLDELTRPGSTVGEAVIRTCGSFVAVERMRAGVEPSRVRLAWVSAAEGRKFAQLIETTVEELRALGPFKQFPRSAP